MPAFGASARKLRNKSRLSFFVWVRPQIEMPFVEQYNTVLRAHSLLARTDGTVTIDNEAVYEVWRRNLDINSSGWTACLRRPFPH